MQQWCSTELERMSRKNVAILSVSAQEDNLGDIEIREKLFKSLTRARIDILGYQGKSSASYMEAFSGYKNSQWFTSMPAMQIGLLGRLIIGQRLHFFIAPGPATFSSKPKAVA